MKRTNGLANPRALGSLRNPGSGHRRNRRLRYEGARSMERRPIRMHRLKDEAAIRSVVEAVRAEPNGEVASIERKIAEFESRWGMSSDEMRERVDRGELAPTRDVEAWLMALRVRDDLASVKARAR